MSTSSAEVVAIRNPKRGKAHRIASDWAVWYFAPTTQCGLPARNFTEQIEAKLTAPEDRCRSCFRETTGERFA